MSRERNEIMVFITHAPATCSECGEQLGRQAWVRLMGEQGAICLSCADLDHLLFLPSGDAALTRRAARYSTLKAVVLQWSKARNSYERQGLLVEADALERAEQECLSDADVRALRQERQAQRQAERDAQYSAHFAARVRELYPNMPEGREQRIAEHACLKYSGRVGRSADAKSLKNDAIHLAVAAHARHAETDYDKLLAAGMDRHLARWEIQEALDRVLALWKKT